jgi:hypothetical protein
MLFLFQPPAFLQSNSSYCHSVLNIVVAGS